MIFKTAARLLGAIIVIAFGAFPATPAQALTLEEFLGQVRASNKGVQSATTAAHGAETSSDLAALLLAPTLFGDIHFVDDRTPQAVPVFQGDRTQISSYQLGVQQLTPWGLEGQFSYLFQRYQISDVSPVFLPQSSYYQAGPVLKLSQSLWRNGFGARTRAEQVQDRSQQLASSYTQSYSARVQLATAESAYYRLALARESIRVERESLDRAQKIRDWNARRVGLHLADEADLLQAEAALELRKLDLQGGLDEERSASRAFNTAREVDSDTVEELVPLDAAVIAALVPPARAPQRDDVRAAGEQAKAAEATAEMQLQTLLPDVQLYGSYAYNGRDPSPRLTAWDSWTANHPTWTVGLKFTAPLDLGLIMKSRSGEKELLIAAGTNFERKVFEADNEWRDLEKSFDEAKRRLILWRSVETAQDSKLRHEKGRFAQGRTTAFQVLSFEQDFLAAQISRVRAENDIVQCVAKMKTFQSDGSAVQ